MYIGKVRKKSIRKARGLALSKKVLNNFSLYRFTANPSGALWYHAHLGGLRADGAFGLFIVHKKEPLIPHYPMNVQHWTKVPFDELMITNPYKKKMHGDIGGDGSNQMAHYPDTHTDMWENWKVRTSA